MKPEQNIGRCRETTIYEQLVYRSNVMTNPHTEYRQTSRTRQERRVYFHTDITLHRAERACAARESSFMNEMTMKAAATKTDDNPNDKESTPNTNIVSKNGTFCSAPSAVTYGRNFSCGCLPPFRRLTCFTHVRFCHSCVPCRCFVLQNAECVQVPLSQ